jgi:hypothetical protein
VTLVMSSQSACMVDFIAVRVGLRKLMFPMNDHPYVRCEGCQGTQTEIHHPYHQPSSTS